MHRESGEDMSPRDESLSDPFPFSASMHGTARGPFLLFDGCPPGVVASLRADEGLRAFARVPEREHQRLFGIAQQTDSKLTLASTLSGDIVGEVTLVPAGGWWKEETNVYEVAMQVSPPWRRQGVACHLLTSALEAERWEDVILLGFGLYWHWDLANTGLTVWAYRKMLARFLAAYQFMEYLTTDPNIRMERANIFLVRLGRHVDEQVRRTFSQSLLR